MIADGSLAENDWQFDHLGVVVKSLEKGRRAIGAALGIEVWGAEIADEMNGVRLQFGRDRGGVCYELLEPLGPDSPVQAALLSKSALLNHVAYRVPDLAIAAKKLRDGSAVPTSDPKPAIAFGGAQIQFFVTAAGFIVELIEAIDADIASPLVRPPINMPALKAGK